MGSGWYYVLNDTRIGPVEHSEIERLVSQGSLEAHTLVWREGLDGWEEAAHHFKFSGDVSGPPPIPTRERGADANADVPASANTARDQERDSRASGLYPGAPARGFGEAISTCLGKYVTFSGRASRSEFWYFVLFSILISLATTIVDSFAFGIDNELSPFNTLIGLALFLPHLSVSVRRLHDTNRSGWWIGGFWLGLIGFGGAIGMIAAQNPYADSAIGGLSAVFGIAILIYIIAMLVFFCQRGDPAQNRFG